MVARVELAHMISNPTASHDLSTSSISSVDYTFDIIRHGGTNTDNRNSPAFAIVVKQNGEYYRGWQGAPVGIPAVGFGIPWTTFQGSIQQDEFFLVRTATTPITSPEHPDFSCNGGIVEFGFYSGNSRDPLSTGTNAKLYSIYGGIDNLCITINVEPCAPTPPPVCKQTYWCKMLKNAVPQGVLDAALANPASVGGWGKLLNPGVPEGPMNGRRCCLCLSNIGGPYDAKYNPLEWRAGGPCAGELVPNR
jgi:hypothetical protein